MNFLSVYDVSQEVPRVVGILIVGETGQLAAAAIEGDVNEPDSPFRIVRDLAREPISAVVLDRGQRIRRQWMPGDPGFYEALLHELRPPLAPGPRGNVTRISTPDDMLRRIWSVVNPEAPMPQAVSSLSIERGV